MSKYVMREQDELYHHGILGMKWGIRRYQNKDGSLTSAGRKRYKKESDKLSSIIEKQNRDRDYVERKKKELWDLRLQGVDSDVYKMMRGLTSDPRYTSIPSIDSLLTSMINVKIDSINQLEKKRNKVENYLSKFGNVSVEDAVLASRHG